MNVDKDVFVPAMTFEQSFGEWLDWLTSEQKAALLKSEVYDLGYGSMVSMAAAVCVAAALIAMIAMHRRAAGT